MIKSKLLTENAWKDIVSKNKGVKDNGLLKTLADIKKLGDDDHDDAQKILDEVLKLSGQLKKSKEIAAIPAVSKFLAELTGAADTAVREVAKAKAEADKVAKAKAEAEKKSHAEAAKKGDDDDDDDEDGESPELLTTKLTPLLRLVAKGQTMHTLVAKSGKQVVVMLSRKPIPPARRKMLAEQLGGGSTKYYPGHCHLEAGATTFVLKAEVAGMSKLVKAALLEQTGLRVNKVKCRGEDGDDDDGDEDEPPDFVPGVDVKPEGEEDDGSDQGNEEPPEFVPGVDIKAPMPELAEAPAVWDGARELLQMNLAALKEAIQQQCADEAQDFVDEVDGHLAKLDRILGKLDRRLSESLLNAGTIADADDRKGELKIAKAIIAEYIRYVNSEPLIEHLDNNPFGVRPSLRATLASSLTQVAKAIG